MSILQLHYAVSYYIVQMWLGAIWFEKYFSRYSPENYFYKNNTALKKAKC
jgi:hypothetical protein